MKTYNMCSSTIAEQPNATENQPVDWCQFLWQTAKEHTRSDRSSYRVDEVYDELIDTHIRNDRSGVSILNPRAYYGRIAALCANRMRTRDSILRKRRTTFSPLEPGPIFNSNTEIEGLNELVRQERFHQVTLVANQLNMPEREVLRLRYVEELNWCEISEVIEVPRSTCCRRANRGINTLRSLLQFADAEKTKR